MNRKLPNNLQPRDVSLGYGGITLHASEDIEEAQLGYSQHPDGSPLTGTEPGEWHAEWLVIGNEQSCGDPIFIDTSEDGFPVFTAMHGEGEWEPEKIADSYGALLQIVDRFAEVAAGREDPEALEDNPMTQAEFDAFMAFVAERSDNEDNNFWALLVEDEDAGIGPNA